MMKILQALVCWLFAASAFGQTSSLFIEDLTWVEVQNAISKGKTTAIYYAGSTEQNGPHMALGKHNLIAKYVANQIAVTLGNALIYPVMPFAPTGDALKKTGHMAFAGSVSVSDETFARVAREVAQSAQTAGFTCIVLMGDHGGGQAALAAVAKELKVVHAIDVYERSNQMAIELLKKRGLPYGDHASIIDTSELMFVAPSAVRLVLRAKADKKMGSDGYAALATAELGRQFVGFKVRAAVAQIQKGCAR